MFEELRKKAIKSSLFLCILLIGGGLVLTLWHAMNVYYVFAGYANFVELKPEQIRSQLVEVDVETNFGYFMYEYEQNSKTHQTRTTHYYYIIWTGDNYTEDYRYMAIKVPAQYQRRMEEMAGNTSQNLLSDPIHFRGKIRKLDGEEYAAFREYFQDAGWSDQEIEDMTLPYYISAYDGTNSMEGAYVILFFLGVGLLIWGIVRLIKVFTGSYLKGMRKTIEASGYTESQIETDYRNAVAFGKKDTIRVGRLMTYYINGATARAVPNNKIMWAYLNTITHRRNGITTGTTYNVMIYDELNAKGRTFTVPNETVAQDVLKKINDMFPWVVVGYTDDLKKMYHKDRAQFLQMRYNTCEHVPVEPGFGNNI